MICSIRATFALGCFSCARQEAVRTTARMMRRNMKVLRRMFQKPPKLCALAKPRCFGRKGNVSHHFKSGISFRFSLYVSAAVAKHFAWLAALNIAQAAATARAWLIPEDDLVGWFRLAHVRTMFYAITWRLTPC